MKTGPYWNASSDLAAKLRPAVRWCLGVLRKIGSDLHEVMRSWRMPLTITILSGCASISHADAVTVYVEAVMQWAGHDGNFESPEEASANLQAYWQATQGGNFLTNLRPQRTWIGPKGQWAFNQYAPYLLDAHWGPNGPAPGAKYGELVIPMSPQCPIGTSETRYIDYDLTRQWLLCTVATQEDNAPPAMCQARTAPPVLRFGNPVFPLQAAKVQEDQDGAPLAGGFTLTRRYSSDQLQSQQFAFAGTAVRSLSTSPFSNTSFTSGGSWCLPLQYAAGGSSKPRCVPVVAFTSTKGGNLLMKRPGAGIRVLALPASGARIAELGREIWSDVDGSGFNILDSNNVLERYSSAGLLLSTTTPNGQSTILAYESVPSGTTQVRLLRAEDTFGRSYSLSYDGVGPVTQIKNVAGDLITYYYGTSSAGCSLSNCGVAASVKYPDASERKYLFNETGLAPAIAGRQFMTGIVDEIGNRFASFSYDSQGRAVTTEYSGGVNRYAIDYSLVSSQVGVVDPLGSRFTFRTATVQSYTVVSGADQPAGSGCAAASSSISYDSNGNKASADDFNGTRVCYASDLGRNLETVRVEGLANTVACTAAMASLPDGSRKTTTQWHPNWRLEVQRAEPGRFVRWIYNGQPDPTADNVTATCAPTTAVLPDGSPIAVLCKKTEQATTDNTGGLGFSASATGTPRTWTYTYNQYGQALTARDPLNKLTNYVYYSDTTDQHTLGDLQSVTDSAGRITQYTRYDKTGRLMQSIDANGAITNATYTPRGWVKTVTVTPPGASVQITAYDYDGVGQLKKATLPDGSALEYTYDAAHRLTSVKDAAGNSVTYTLDNMGNRTGEDLKDPSGTLARNITRVYDALNRAQSATGAMQ